MKLIEYYKIDSELMYFYWLSESRLLIDFKNWMRIGFISSVSMNSPVGVARCEYPAVDIDKMVTPRVGQFVEVECGRNKWRYTMLEATLINDNKSGFLGRKPRQNVISRISYEIVVNGVNRIQAVRSSELDGESRDNSRWDFYSENCIVGRIFPKDREYIFDLKYGQVDRFAEFPDVIQPDYIYPMLMLPQINFVLLETVDDGWKYVSLIPGAENLPCPRR